MDIIKIITAQLDSEYQLSLSSQIELEGILLLSNKNGRFKKYYGDNFSEKQVISHVQKTVVNYKKYNPLVKKLRVEHDTEAWEDLLEKLTKWAASQFIRWGWHRNQGTYQMAGDCARLASGTIMAGNYYYDSDFYGWSRIVLINICRKEIESWKKSHLPLKNSVEIDSEFFSGDFENQLVDKPISVESQVQLKIDMLDALNQLSDSDSELLKKKYFENETMDNLAIHFNTSKGALYVRIHTAKKNLLNILSKNSIDN